MQFKAFDSNAEVSGAAIRSVIDALPSWQASREAALARHGIVDLREDAWYSQQAWLASFEEISSSAGGNHLLFAIGKAIPQSVGAEPTGVRDMLEGMQQTYASSHRHGTIGHYKVLHFDEDERQATVECKNPYPSHFDRGLLTAFLAACLPANPTRCQATLDPEKPSRLNGADACTFLLKW